MEIRPLTEGYAVSPQITPDDLVRIRDAGYRTIVCNRPDAENPPELQSAVIAEAARALGLEFVFNPIVSGSITEANVDDQRAALSDEGPVFAYCASGNRSSVIWALAQAGEKPADWLISTPAKYGYQLDWLRPYLGD